MTKWWELILMIAAVPALWFTMDGFSYLMRKWNVPAAPLFLGWGACMVLFIAYLQLKYH